MKKILVGLLGIVLVNIVSAEKLQTSFESVVKQTSQANITCLSYKDGVNVVSKPNKDSNAGNQYFIIQNSCVIGKNKNIIKTPNQAYYYLGRVGKLLFFDVGTSTNGRKFYIYSLKSNEFVHSDQYVGELQLNNKNFEYWKPNLTNQDFSSCSEYTQMKENGLQAQLADYVVLNLKTFNYKIDNKVNKCFYTQ
jgi:hypothetical protein